MPTEGEQLNRLAEVLQHRGAPLERVLSAVSVSGMSTLHLGVSALSQCMQLLMPIRPETLEIVAPGVQPPPMPEKGVVAMFVDGKNVRGSIIALGTRPAVCVEGAGADSSRRQRAHYARGTQLAKDLLDA